MAELKIKADSGGGTVSFKGPATTTSNAAVQLTLPVDDGTANQYLKTDGSGALSWATVDTSIADNAITLAKMAGGTDGQIITYDASGDPVAVGPGTDGQVLTSTGAGSPPAFEDVPGGGITRAELWRITTDNSISQDWGGSPGDAIQVIVNWELNDQSGAGVISSGMTESSGVFTFPETGIWQVDGCFQQFGNYFSVHTIDVTEDNSTWVRANELYIGTFDYNFRITGPMRFIFDVGDTANDKIRFGCARRGASWTATVLGDSARTESWASFTRLGDT